LESVASRADGRSLVIDPLGSYSYTELLSSANDVTSFLRSQSVPAGSVIGFSANEARCFIPLLFGILQADCVALPISPNLSERERHIYATTTHIGATLSVSNETTTQASSVALPGSSRAALTKENPTQFDIVRRSFPTAAVMRFTSGTTSTAKGVVLSHEGVLERADACQRIFDITEHDRILSPLPLSYHFIASVMAFIRAGATILDSAGLRDSDFASFVRASKATFAYAAPSHYRTLCEHARLDDVKHLRKAVSASAPLSTELARLFESRFNRRLIQAYGIIEVGLPLWNDNAEWKPEALGEVKAPYEYQLVDELGVSAHQSEVGELAVRGPGLFSGYVMHSGDVIKHPRNGWFLTGDLVQRSPDGTLAFKGRKQSRIVVGDHHIYPEEIERVLKRSSAIAEARVSAERDPALGTRLIAEIVLRDQSLSPSQSWLELCAQDIPVYQRPDEFRIVSAIPSTGSGKVIRRRAL